jgi:Fe-S cluster assembly iron-binding protein IscA
MRAKEFIVEQYGRTGSLQQDISLALPGAWKIPALKNQDPYLQYRFGVAIAGAKGAEQRARDDVPKFEEDQIFGENEFVVSYDPKTINYIRDALVSMGMSASDAKQIASNKGEEMPDVDKRSPVIGFKGYPR